MKRLMARLNKSIPLCIILACAFIAALQGDAFSNPTGPEGIEWQLVEVAGVPVLPPANGKQPYIRLDPAQKKATGFAGCNNFFCGYELDGSSLKFGLIGATRMACPEPETRVETALFKALESTGGWKIKDGTLLLTDDSGIVARFEMKRVEPVPDLRSMTFLSRWLESGKVTLARGEYREPLAPGSASEILVKLNEKGALGFIGGKETGAAVIVTDPGGSGTFHDLALLRKESKGWVNTDTVFLGDRVNIRAIEIKNDRIIISMITHGPEDPMCCPTREVVNIFTVKEDKLVPVADRPSTNNMPEIIGIRWKWEQTLYNNDTKTMPAEPERYTLTLHSDGKVTVSADCNRGVGTYIKKDSSISLNITCTTRAMCPPDSLEGEFLRNLAAAAIYFMKGGNLYFDLKADTGTMKFSKL